MKTFSSGSITIYNGDSFELVKTLEFPSNTIIVTDPPFNVGYHYDGFSDRKDEEDYVDGICSLMEMFPSVVVNYPEKIYEFAIRLGRVPNRVVSWIYNSNTARQHRDIAYFGINPCFDGIGEYKNPTDKRVMKLISEGRNPRGYDWIYSDQVKNVSHEKTEHPCQMPLDVMDYVMKTIPGDSFILEPFMGSGTTVLSAKRNGFGVIGIELVEKYFDIAKSRIEGMNGTEG